MLDISDTLVRIYLYFVVFSSALSGILLSIVWVAQRRRLGDALFSPKLLWGNGFFFLSGLIAWYLFSFLRWSNWLVLLCTTLMLVISVIATEALAKRLGKERLYKPNSP